MNRKVVLLALGFALLASGCAAAVGDESTPGEPSGNQSSGLESTTDPDNPTPGDGTEQTGSVTPGVDPTTEGPTPNPWKLPETSTGIGSPSPQPDPEDTSGSAQTTSSGN